MSAFALLLLPGAMAYAAAMDLLTMTIPNKVSIALVAGFVLLAAYAGLSWDVLGLHLLTGFVVLAVCFGLFAFGFVGGGDAKLLAAGALWFGWPLVITFLIYTALLGGVLAFVLLLARRLPLPISLMRVEWLARLHDDKQGAPYGVAIAAAAMLAYPESFWFTLIQ